MNRDCHRIIFNRHRGQWMAVAETAQRPSGGTRRERAARAALAIALLLGAAAPPVLAQIIADPKAPAQQRPTILSDSQGRPLVNIQAPSASGLSRNTYQQFDVPTGGIVLNNSASNPWLAKNKPALTILNEVNSTQQTYINGAVTVLGTSAQVIVANPKGITINGGKFVNARRATLTTGQAQVSQGVLQGFDVRGGTVTLGANGFDNSATPYTDILSRAASIAGKLSAQELAITTGKQTVAYDTGAISNHDATPATDRTFAIDTAALGGMQANRITLLATEAGLGIRNQGTWQASGGQIAVTADGYLHNLGSISAGVASLATVQGHIENKGTLRGAQALAVSSGGNIRLYGNGMAQTTASSVIASAQGSITLYSTTAEGAAAITSNTQGGSVTLSAGQNLSLQSGSRVTAHGNVDLTADAAISASGASATSSTGRVLALAGTGMTLANTTVTGPTVHLETGSPFKATAAAITVTGGKVSGAQQTTLLATSNIAISGTGVSGAGHVHIQADKAVTAAAGTQISAGGHMSVIAGTGLTLSAAAGSTTANGKNVALSAKGNLLVSGNSVTATGSSLSAGQGLSIEALNGNINLHALPNTGGTGVSTLQLTAGKDLNVSTFQGSLLATGLQASGQNINLMSNGTTRVAHADTKNGNDTKAVGSIVKATQDITIGSAGATGQVSLVASSLNAGGAARVLSHGTTLVAAATDTLKGVNQAARSSITAGSVAIQGATVQASAANIQANGNGSTPARSGNLTVTATGGGATFAVHAGQHSQLKASASLALHASGDLLLQRTQANAGGGLSGTSASGQITAEAAQLTAKDVLSLASKKNQTHANGLYSGGAASLYNQGGHLALTNTRIQAKGTPTAGLSSVSGQASIESGGTLALDAASTLAAATDLSIVQGQGNITINPAGASRGTLSLEQISAGRHLTLATRNGKLSLTGSAGSNGPGSSRRVEMIVTGDLNLIASQIDLQGSQLLAQGALNVTATTGDLKAAALRTTRYAAGHKDNPAQGIKTGFTNTYWDHALLASTQAVNLRAAGNITLTSVTAFSDKTVNILSGGNVAIAGTYGHWTVDNRLGAGSPVNGWYQDETFLTRSLINGPAGVSIGALGGSLRLSATDVVAASGTASLQALGHVHLLAAQEHMLHQASSTQAKKTWFGLKKKVYTTHLHNEYLLADPVWVAGRDIEVKAGNDIETYATQFKASRNLTLQAGDAIRYHAVQDQVLRSATTTKTSSLIGFKYSSSTHTDSSKTLSGQPTRLQSQKDILSQSGADQLLQGTQVAYGGKATFQAGVGEKARADARIILEGIKTTTTQTRTKESNYVVWQRQINKGSVTETLALPSFSGPVKPSFSAPGGLTVQIPEASDLKAQVSALAKQPGTAYLNDLAKRKDVNWQPVKLAFDQWNYKQEGLTPAGAALLAAAVAWAVPPGTGANLIGAKTGTTAMMANAAFASLSAQAAIAFVNNGGDIGKTLKALGSSQAIKATIAAMLTAGVLDTLGATQTMKDLAAKGGLGEKLTYNLINASGRALTNTAISGGNLEQALKDALLGGVVDTLHGQATSHIKGLEADYLAHKLAHALAGCAAGAAMGSTCKSGAIGAAVGEAVAELMPPANGMFYTATEKNNVLALSKLVAGATAAYAGGNAQTAIATSETAVSNNAFFVPPLVYLLMAAAGGYTTGVGNGNPVEGLKTIGEGKDPLSKALANGTQAAVSLSMQNYPKETLATLNFLAATGQSVDATLSYVDSKTGKVVSTSWNSLSPDTRNALIGAGKVTGVVLSPVGVGQIRTLVTKTPQAPGAKTLALDVEGKTAQAYVSNNFNRDGADPALMKKMLDTAAQSATHNASSTEVILGRYIVGNDQSYEKVAQTRGATYFQLTSENWMKTANVINNDGMWEINKTFLDQQIKLGKDFIFTSDPSKFPLNSSSQREFTHLISKGYNFSPTGNGMYHATKK